MSLLQAVSFLSFWTVGIGLSKLEQSDVSVSAEIKKSVNINCKISSTQFETEVIHWYWKKPNKTFEHLIQVTSTKSAARGPLNGMNNKIEAKKYSQTLSSVLTIYSIQKEDAAMYYCAGWYYSQGWMKIFGEGTKLIVSPSDKISDADLSPKPTIFLPSVSEINLHKAGTHLCLLENFSPDVIKVFWKEKGGDRILESQQGDTMKTNDTYMKMSWLTVTEESMDKEHRCIVKHENNKGGGNLEVLFPAIKKDVTRTEACSKDENSTLRLQLTNTSAYYTYLLLLLKSGIYLAIVTYCLLRRTAVCSHGKSS